jgi:hypothetical protein
VTVGLTAIALVGGALVLGLDLWPGFLFHLFPSELSESTSVLGSRSSFKLPVFGLIGMEQVWNRGGATGGKRSARQRPVGFVNSVVLDFQGNLDSMTSGISAATSAFAADTGERPRGRVSVCL